jgi:hypothetical protein
VAQRLEVFAVEGIGEVRPGDDLAGLIVAAVDAGEHDLADGDVVVARGFADPAITLPIAARLARSGGWVIISEPPPEHGSSWDRDWVHSLGVGMPERQGQVVRFHVEH